MGGTEAQHRHCNGRWERRVQSQSVLEDTSELTELENKSNDMVAGQRVTGDGGGRRQGVMVKMCHNVLSTESHVILEHYIS